MRRGDRAVQTLLANFLMLVVVRGLRGWGRNLLSIAPAVGSMVILLVLSGAAGLAAMAAAATLSAQSEEAYVLHIYIADQAPAGRVDDLRAKLAADPRVRSVLLVPATDTLRRELHRPGVSGLVEAAGGNPFPASLDVRLSSPAAIAPVADWVSHDPAVDPVYPTSYDPGTYARLRILVNRLASAGVAVLAVLAFVSVTVTANAVRAAVVARRDELRIMRLVGAPWWAVRLPFLVEGGLTGAASGVVAAAVVVGVVMVLAQTSVALFTDLLPGVTTLRVIFLAAALVLGGGLLGASSGGVAVRRLPA